MITRCHIVNPIIHEFLPVLLGSDGLAPYTGYKPDVNPGIANIFATAAVD